MKKKVCIVSCGIFGVPEGSEQSEYAADLAHLLVSSGFEVNILLAYGLNSEYRNKINSLKSYCFDNKIRFFYLMQINKDFFSYSLKTDNLINSYQVYNWFKTHGEFDVIFFVDSRGIAFYSLFAKHQGLIFQKTNIFIKVFNTLRQNLYKNKLNFDSVSYITDDFIEKKTIELCDVLIIPSVDNISYFNNISWKMPERVEILTDVVSEKEQNDVFIIKLIEESISSRSCMQRNGEQGYLSSCGTDISICKEEGVFDNPRVTVCLVHHERPQLLRYAIDSVRKQDYQNLEVVLIDDGSEDKASLDYLNNLSEEFVEKNWKIVRQMNLYPGAARNRGAREASGDYIVFLDDDDYLKPYAISTFIGAAKFSNADVLTCFNEIFNSEFEPNRNNINRISIFTGDIASGIFENSFGPITSFFRKDVFLEIGGFHELKGIAYEDWEIFAKLALKGYVVEVLPESLFFYRILKNNKKSVNRSTDTYYNNYRILEAYIKGFDENMASALMYLKDTKNIAEKFKYLNDYIFFLKKELKEKFGITINNSIT